MAHVLYKGIEWRRRICVTDRDESGVDTGVRTNLTGKVLKLEVRRRTGGPVLIELTSGDGITHLDQGAEGTRGIADLVIAVEDQAVLDAPALHVLNVQLDDQVITPPQHLEVALL